ncbi:hypothetical protein SBA3_4300007 [Candidatus Sulfopaludibacter sp. SbA3]|nr:hypothetical protein SBA3_4300007 [Candidatus Sulfopaludibacter sp. SbA3]
MPLARQGLYRFAAEPPRLKVFAGKAVVESRGRRVVVASGRMIALENSAPSAERFDSRRTDAFDYWTEWRVAALAKLSGLTERQAQQRLENEAAERRAASLEGQTRDPRSIHYDPLAPSSQGPGPSPGPGGTAPGRARVCAASGR